MPALRRAFRYLLLGGGGLLLTLPVFSQPDEDRCAQERAAPPRTPYGAECFQNGAMPPAETAAVRARLEAWAAADPADPWVHAALCLALAERDVERAVTLGERASAAFAGRRDAVGEAYARLVTVYPLRRLRRLDQAQAELARGRQLAAAVDDPTLSAVAARAELQVHEGLSQLDAALLVAREAIGEPWFQAAPRRTRQRIPALASEVALRLGAFEDVRRFSALDLSLRVDPVALRWGRTMAEADFRSRLADFGLASDDEAMRAVIAAYETARETGSVYGQARYLCIISGYATDPDDAKRWMARCDERAGSLGCVDEQLGAALINAVRMAEDPARRREALALAEATRTRARALGDLVLEVRALESLAGVRALARPRHEASRSFEEALAALERLRARLADPEQRAALFSRWRTPYLYAAFLAVGDGSTAEDRERAFEVLESVRARTLEDALADIATRPAAIPPGEEADALDTIRRRIDTLRQELAALPPDDPKLPAALQELDQLDARESAALVSLMHRDPAWGTWYRPEIASLRAVQAGLSPDEALLSYQLAQTRDEQPWVMLITASGLEAIRLPDHDYRAAAVLYRGLLDRRDGSERETGASLTRALLAPVLRRLDPQVQRLYLVADGPLGQIPLGALPQPDADRPLAQRYEITFVPSASRWLRWRTRAALATAPDGLALADPVLARHGDPSGHGSGGLRGPSPGLAGRAPLPHARVEADAMAAALGPGSQVLRGSAATEAALKQIDVKRFAVLHFGAHAIANYLRASRSAILLTRAPPDDGYLEAGEIAALPLSGQLVVLSACDTAEGRVAAGEGALSLTHAFLGAGAGAVLSTLWPVRDDDAALLITRFYTRLAAGHSAAAALAQSQRDLATGGAPPAAWAGFVLVGDGGWHLGPVPPHRGSRRLDRAPLFAGAAALLAGALAAYYLVSRSRARS